MANITNRSPWIVKLPGQESARFRLKSQALAHLSSLGLTTGKPAKGTLKQLETAFEVQITRKDSKGTVIKRSQTLDTLDQAKSWAKDMETELDAYFSPSWTAFQADRGRYFSVIVDGVSN